MTSCEWFDIIIKPLGALALGGILFLEQPVHPVMRDEQTKAALRAAHSAMARVLSANRATIDMPAAYWNELYDAFVTVALALPGRGDEPTCDLVPCGPDPNNPRHGGGSAFA